MPCSAAVSRGCSRARQPRVRTRVADTPIFASARALRCATAMPSIRVPGILRSARRRCAATWSCPRRWAQQAADAAVGGGEPRRQSDRPPALPNDPRPRGRQAPRDPLPRSWRGPGSGGTKAAGRGCRARWRPALQRHGVVVHRREAEQQVAHAAAADRPWAFDDHMPRLRPSATGDARRVAVTGWPDRCRRSSSTGRLGADRVGKAIDAPPTRPGLTGLHVASGARLAPIGRLRSPIAEATGMSSLADHRKCMPCARTVSPVPAAKRRGQAIQGEASPCAAAINRRRADAVVSAYSATRPAASSVIARQHEASHAACRRVRHRHVPCRQRRATSPGFRSAGG